MTRSNTRTRPSNETSALDSADMENKAGGLDASPANAPAETPAETPAEPAELMKGIEVKMLQHWTNPEGRNIPPGPDPVELDPATASRLVQAHYAEYV